MLKYCVGGSCLLYIEAGPICTIVCSEMISSPYCSIIIGLIQHYQFKQWIYYMELNPSSAETVFAVIFTWCHRHVNKQGLNARVKPNCGVIVISSKQQKHCMVESTGYYEGGVGRVLSLSCILFSMVVCGNLMTFKIIELDYVS